MGIQSYQSTSEPDSRANISFKTDSFRIDSTGAYPYITRTEELIEGLLPTRKITGMA